MRDAIRRRHYSERTEETYVHWIKRFIYFSGRRHPAELGEVLAQPLPWLAELERARRPARMQGPKWLMASLLYGAGLRLRECLKLRVKAISRQAMAMSSCPTRSPASIRGRNTSGVRGVKSPLDRLTSR